MISLNDTQLKIVMAAAEHVPIEKRAQFLERVAARLALFGRGRFTNDDVDDAVKLARIGLVHRESAV